MREMEEELFREILKLEARLEAFSKKEESFVNELRRFIKKLKDINGCLKRCKEKGEFEEAVGLVKLRLEVFEYFEKVLEKESDSEHEKSHLLESYGHILLTLERMLRELRLEKMDSA